MAAGRAIEQMKDWFGCLPDFLVTVDVVSGTFDDASFCALVEHELYHCAQATDAFGYPKFHRDSGDPIWGIRGHDVEECRTRRWSSAWWPATAPRRPERPSWSRPALRRRWWRRRRSSWPAAPATERRRA
jgi:hypothetical protein